ncbi:MAG: condensation domain-containing protein, partial [Psychrosphaera sp.]|nr:condensation domain-containing protein [Psychrosphaera sp.]
LTMLDLCAYTDKQEVQQTVKQAAQNDAKLAFNLGEDLMLRCSFIRLSADEGVLLFNMHHIASDGWSMGLLVKEFWAQYQAILSGKPNLYQPLDIQYADYAQWQRDFVAGIGLTKGLYESQLNYWQQQLADLPQMHSLPLASHLQSARPKEQTFNGATLSIKAKATTLLGLKQLAFEHNATLFMVLQGVFSLLLSRHSNFDDIVVGVPVANRPQTELEPIIGLFINTLVLRTDCSGNPSFIDFLQQVKTTNLDAQANQDVSFEQLVERLQPVRSTAHAPLFQVLFSMDTNATTVLELPDVSLTPLVNSDATGVSKYELTLNASETDLNGQLDLGFEYNTDLFDAASIEQMAQHFVCLLDGIVANPNTRIDALPMLSQDEQHQLLHTLNNTSVDYSNPCSIHALFEQQVIKTPDNIALTYLDEKLSYQVLNQKANQLAHYLIEQGVGPNVLVGLSIERSADMVIGLLAI